MYYVLCTLYAGRYLRFAWKTGSALAWIKICARVGKGSEHIMEYEILAYARDYVDLLWWTTLM